MTDQFQLSLRTAWSLLPVAAIVLSALNIARPSEPGLALFEKQVRPLLNNHCWECHAAKEQEAGLRLDSREAMIRGGQAGPAMVPHKPDKSLLIEAIQYENPDFQMPPDGRLAAKSIEVMRQWIALGAPWPAARKTGSSTHTHSGRISIHNSRHSVAGPGPVGGESVVSGP